MSDDIKDPFEEDVQAKVPARQTDPNEDPFANRKLPAVSFHEKPVGTEIRFRVTKPATMVQQRDYDTDEPKFWPDGNPRMAAVFQGVVNGEDMSLWVPKPSSLFTAVTEAQHATGGARIDVDDTLVITLTGLKEARNQAGKKLNDQKLYGATCERAGS